MKTNKLLFFITVLSIAFSFVSCNKEDLSHSLDNTYWISETTQNSDQCWAFSFNNGYVQHLRLDPITHHVRYLDYTAEYSVKGEKLIIYIEISGKIRTFEATYKKGIIYINTRRYYLH